MVLFLGHEKVLGLLAGPFVSITKLLFLVATISKLATVAPLIADPPLLTPPLCTLGRFAKAKYFMIKNV